VLAAELEAVVEEACADARLPRLGVGRVRSGSPLLLAAHAGRDVTAIASTAAERTGLAAPDRAYTAACVAASSAVADAAAGIAAGRLDRAVVAAGFLVDAGTFGLFDAGRALARDGYVRPFSAGRQGTLLGDAVAAVVLEAAGATRGVPALATLAGWGRAGDAFGVCQPRPDGTGLARAASAALARAGVPAGEVGYVNANGTGTPASDASESEALRLVFADALDQVPVSSTKSVHGHALEASALLELVVTVLALRDGRLPVNAGFLAADADCPLDLVLDEPRPVNPRYALSLNAAFGGANTALLVGAA
jgi:3-oxoacyl-(acyl-carrier-protein) synthase